MDKEIKLSPRQQAFAEYYLECGVQEEAAIKAGYSKNYAAKRAYLLLENVGIKQYIEERSKEPTNELIASSDEVLEFYSKGMRGEIKDQFDLDAALSDRIKCADALAKRYGLVRECLEIEDKTGGIAAILKEARERAEKHGSKKE